MFALFKFLRGYVRIRLTGGSPERFLNLCSKNSILIWNIMPKDHSYEMYLSVPAFRKLKTIIRKTNVTVRILERHGFPFFLYKYRKRKMFFAGIAACAVFVYILSLFVWQIEFNGNRGRTDDVLLQFLEEHQVVHGMWKSKVNCEEIETLLRAEFNDIIWTSAKLVGTRLIVDIQENTDTSVEHIQENQPSDLYANKEAIITSIITRAGTPYVQMGDVVKTGDLLVGSALPITDDAEEIINYQYVAADADIYGKVNYNYEDSFSLDYKLRTVTGNNRYGLYLKWNQKSVILGCHRIKYNTYHTISDIHQLTIGENFYLPISVGSVTVCEDIIETKKYTKAQAEQKAKERLLKFMESLEEKGVQIQQNNVTIEIDKNTCHASGRLTAIEKLGIRKEATAIDLNIDGKEQQIDGESGSDN
ncbi:MAG: sporulation protein YqfD [Lachnospiraceae bacterium]|nr:sporulation protein YqfD [Lachnospiraceae bacterium]